MTLTLVGLLVLTAAPSLRVLVRAENDDFLPPQADPTHVELELLERFAIAQGRALQTVPVETFAELIPALLAGKGDVIAAGLTITDERKKVVTFTRPTRAVDELLVARKGAEHPPLTPKDLAGRTVTVPHGSSFIESLARIPGVRVVEQAQVTAADQLPFELERGAIELTVVDSVRLDALQAYLPHLDVRFPIAQGRGLGFALRPGDEKLRATLDAFLIERAFRAGVTDEVGDLPAIKARGTVRVLTRNNAVSFYLYRGNREGFDYELAKGFAKSQGLTLEVVLAPSYDALIPMLNAGKGDFIAASLTATADRAKDVAFSRPYLQEHELFVQRKGAPPLIRLEQLRGRTVTVRPSSSYAERLRPLAAQLGFTLAPADEDLEVEDLLADVDEGVIELTVADAHFFRAEAMFRKNLEAPLALSEAPAPIAFASRHDNPLLAAALDAFVKKVYRGADYNMLKRRSFENRTMLSEGRALASSKTGQLSPFDPVIRKYSLTYGFDWRLMSAQAWRESLFDPKATSFAGALGLFQVMPATGKELGFTKLMDPEQGTHAGIKYMSQLVRRVEPALPLDERVRFALAGYNAGFGRVQDARRLAAELNLNPDVWAGNVEKAMGLMARPKYARRVRTGFCRCQEPVDYVRVIENKYQSFMQIVQ